jgi:hypothetical protein
MAEADMILKLHALMGEVRQASECVQVNPPTKKCSLQRWNFLQMNSGVFAMKKSWFTDSQIMAVLKQSEGGTPIPDLCR